MQPNDLLARIQELDERANGAPWTPNEPYIESPDEQVADGVWHSADADLIAEYRNTTPRLAAALEAVLGIADRADRKDIYAPLLDEAVQAIHDALEIDDE